MNQWANPPTCFTEMGSSTKGVGRMGTLPFNSLPHIKVPDQLVNVSPWVAATRKF